MAKRLSNVQIVTKMMTYGNPMKQLVIVTAIEKYAKMCLERPADEFDSGLLDGQSWLDTCQEILDELAQHYGR